VTDLFSGLTRSQQLCRVLQAVERNPGATPNEITKGLGLAHNQRQQVVWVLGELFEGVSTWHSHDFCGDLAVDAPLIASEVLPLEFDSPIQLTSAGKKALPCCSLDAEAPEGSAGA